jgi:hypothetical protein
MTMHFDDSTAIYKGLKSLYPGEIRTRDLWFCRWTRWPQCHAARGSEDSFTSESKCGRSKASSRWQASEGPFSSCRSPTIGRPAHFSTRDETRATMNASLGQREWAKDGYAKFCLLGKSPRLNLVPCWFAKRRFAEWRFAENPNAAFCRKPGSSNDIL